MQYAVFVDAGYLYAAGSAMLTGEAVVRDKLTLCHTHMAAQFASAGTTLRGNPRLLRIYWYDAARPGTGLTRSHQDIADLNDIKLRLGYLNSKNQQKGVDSLIVTDLIELARNKAITDAILVSGDEDLRVGVQIAQTFGVRVHLLGIHPQRSNQARTLLQECDFSHEWGLDEIKSMLSLATHDAPLVLQPATKAAVNQEGPTNLAGFAENHLKMLDESAREKHRIETAKLDRGLPSELDRPMLGAARGYLDRDLTDDERARLRNIVRRILLNQTP